MSGSALAASFLESLPPGGLRPEAGDLDETLAELISRGQVAWPTIRLDPAAFARYLGERSALGAPPRIERAADLYIACACLAGAKGAIEAFIATFRPGMVAAAQRVLGSRGAAEDVAQVQSERLLIAAEDGPARIRQYEGRASLRGWIEIGVRRAALNAVRNPANRPSDSVSGAAAGLEAAAGPEIQLLKARYKSAFEAAIRAAVAILPPRDRTLLLLHFVEGVTLPQLATLQQVSRATVARWLRSAREALHHETHQRLVGSLRLSASELASVAALVRSQLDVSLSGAIGAHGDAQ